MSACELVNMNHSIKAMKVHEHWVCNIDCDNTEDCWILVQHAESAYYKYVMDMHVHFGPGQELALTYLIFALLPAGLIATP